jgi:long-chain acyl-CoA synthetase
MKNPWFKHYAKHIPHNINYPEIPIHRFLTDTVAKQPDYIAYTFNETDTTYKELNDKVNKFALILQNIGVKKGDRVALIMVNSPTYVIAFFGVMKLGAIVANISVGIQGEELTRCLNNAGVKVVVTLDIFAQNLYHVVKNTEVKNVILHSVFGLEKKITLEEGMPEPQIFLEMLASIERAAEPVVEILPADVAVLQYTSGSTGAPKAATLTHYNIVTSVIQSDTWMGVTGAGNAAVMCIIPFFHVFGMSSCLLVSVLKGYRMILLPRIDLMDILSLMKMLETYKPISFPAVPSLWSAIMSRPPETVRALFSSIKVAVSGGAPLAPSVHDKFEELTGRKIMEAYGLSEASSATHITPYPQGAPRGSVGLPLPDTQVRILDMETGSKDCNVGEVGELVIKGPQIMQGYWNNKELTAAVLRDGWFYTGDMARMDKDGYFYLVDRKDDLIISNGYNVYPGQIEDILKRHPKIRDAAVIGIPDRVKGQAIIAVIALQEGEQADKDEFLKYCRENLPEYRLPKTILIHDEIPRDPAGKLLRRILRQTLNNSLS